MKGNRVKTDLFHKQLRFNNILRSKTLYWLLLFIILYIVSCKSYIDDNLTSANSNLLAVAIVDYKYEIEFFEENSKCIDISIPESIESNEMARIKNIVNSNKTQSQVYKEIAGKSVMEHYVEVMKAVDGKIHKRRLIIRK